MTYRATLSICLKRWGIILASQVFFSKSMINLMCALYLALYAVAVKGTSTWSPASVNFWKSCKAIWVLKSQYEVPYALSLAPTRFRRKRVGGGTCAPEKLRHNTWGSHVNANVRLWGSESGNSWGFAIIDKKMEMWDISVLPLSFQHPFIKMLFLFKPPSVLPCILSASQCPPHNVLHGVTEYPLYYDPLYSPVDHTMLFESEQSVCQWLWHGLVVHWVGCSRCFQAMSPFNEMICRVFFSSNFFEVEFHHLHYCPSFICQEF